MKVQIKNYTPHTVSIVRVLENEIEVIKGFESMGEARCRQCTTYAKPLKLDAAEIPLTQTSFGEVSGLPEKEEGVYLIVSRLVRQALADRDDLLVPNDLVRNPDGVIMGCKSLAIN